MKDQLLHYGIKGQKWGVRRYQNADGTLTEQGKARYAKGIEHDIRVTRYNDKKLSDIDRSLSWQQNAYLNGVNPSYVKDKSTKWTYGQVTHKVFQDVGMKGDKPVGYFILQKLKQEGALNAVIAVDSKHQGKGYAGKMIKKGLEWFNNNPQYSKIYWYASMENTASQHLAQKNGFKQIERPQKYDQYGDAVYEYTKKK